jgi:hypothetical protein
MVLLIVFMLLLTVLSLWYYLLSCAQYRISKDDGVNTGIRKDGASVGLAGIIATLFSMVPVPGYLKVLWINSRVSQ